MPNLSCRFWTSVAGVNNFKIAQQLQFTEGGTTPIYLQLIDLDQDGPDTNTTPPYRRYAPQPGATLQVTLLSLDDSTQVTKAATQPFPGDASVWTFTAYPSDHLRGTVSLRLALNEGGVFTYSVVQAALLVRSKGG